MIPPRAEDLLPLDHAIAGEIQALLAKAGHYRSPIGVPFDAATRAALEQYGGVENLEERLISPERIDPEVLDYMREKIGAA